MESDSSPLKKRNSPTLRCSFVYLDRRWLYFGSVSWKLFSASLKIAVAVKCTRRCFILIIGLFFQVVLVVPNINFEVQAIIPSTKFPASALHRSVTVWLVFECFAFRRIIRAVGIVYRGNSFKPGEKGKLMHKQRGMCKCV